MIWSRRAFVFGGPAVCIAKSHQPTSPLLEASKRFDVLKQRLDSNEKVNKTFWAELRCLSEQLVELRATTAQEYFAKAKAAAWARLGDLDPPRTGTLDTRIAVAVLRDIILQHDPTLYDSGALDRMYAELENEDENDAN